MKTKVVTPRQRCLRALMATLRGLLAQRREELERLETAWLLRLNRVGLGSPEAWWAASWPEVREELLAAFKRQLGGGVS